MEALKIIRKRVLELHGRDGEYGPDYHSEAVTHVAYGMLLAQGYEDPMTADDGMYECVAVAMAHIEAALPRHAWALDGWSDAVAQVESPIERKLLLAMLTMWSSHRLELWFHGTGQWVRCDYTGDESEYYRITPQWKHGRKRIDFRIDYGVYVKHDKLTNTPLYASDTMLVECDGHDYHERTKEQAAKDRKRDREWLAAGVKSVRFTGSEIHKNAYVCVRECSKLLTDAWGRAQSGTGEPMMEAASA